MWGSQKQSGPSGAQQEKEQAVCPSDRVKHAEEAREKKRCSKNQKQLKTQSNVPLLCDKIVLMLCTITNRNKLHASLTVHYSHMFTSIQYAGIHYALNEIIRQREDNNLVGLIEKCDFEENIFFFWRIYIIWMMPLYLIGYSVQMYKDFYFCMDIQTDANMSKPAEHHYNGVTLL